MRILRPNKAWGLREGRTQVVRGTQLENQWPSPGFSTSCLGTWPKQGLRALGTAGLQLMPKPPGAAILGCRPQTWGAQRGRLGAMGRGDAVPPGTRRLQRLLPLGLSPARGAAGPLPSGGRTLPDPWGGGGRSLGVSLPPGALGPPPPPPRLEPGLVPPPAVGREDPRLARHQTGAGCVDQTRFSEVTLQSRRRAGVAREWLRFLGIVTTLGHLNQSRDDPLQNFTNARACTA